MNIPKQFNGETLIHTWEYKSQAGDTLGYVGRYEPDPPDGTKQIIPFFKKKSAGWASGGPAEPKPLYGLDEVANQQEAFVCVVEGEKAAEAVQQLGWVAVSSLGGGNAAGKTDWGPLKGRNVVLFPDNDDAGTKYAQDVATELDGLGVKSYVCSLGGLPEKGDAVDWIQSRVPDWDGYSEDARIRAYASEMLELVKKATPVSLPVMPQPTQDFPEPIPLPDLLSPVQPFDFDLLPEAFRAWVTDIAKRQQSPPDFVAVGAVVAAASVIGRQCRIRPKCKDDWSVVPNLWGACIGRPSTKKSPALSEAMRPLSRLVAEALEEHEKVEKAHKGQTMMAKAKLKVIESQMFKHAKEGSHD